jgi:hypothetical protein
MKGWEGKGVMLDIFLLWLIFLCKMKSAAKGDVGEGIGGDRGLVGLDVGPQERGG